MDRAVLDEGQLEAWLQCERRAWLRRHAPGEAATRGGLGRYLAEQRTDLRALLQESLETMAERVPASSPKFGAVSRTVEALARGDALVLDAAFEGPLRDGARARLRGHADVLQHIDDGWSVTVLAAGTRARPHHVRRLALAWLAAEGMGLAIQRSSVLHMHRRPPMPGTGARLAATDVTERSLVERRRLPNLLPAVAASLEAPSEPQTAIGGHCLRPRRCPFVDHCWSDVGDGNIYRIWGLRGSTRRALRSAGWLRLDQIPDDVPGLNHDERRGLADARAGTVRLERAELRSALERLRPPVAYLDIEFATPAVPWVDGMAPFEPLPFQFSVDIERPEGRVEHVDGLVLEPGADPRPALAADLASALAGAASIVVYDASAEGPLLTRLQELEPALGDATMRLWDLLALIRKTVRHPGFAARWDLKQVATTLSPESYQGVRLPDGLAAQAQWRRLLRRADPDREAELRRYCAADSRAMVEIVRVLRGWVDDATAPP